LLGSSSSTVGFDVLGNIRKYC